MYQYFSFRYSPKCDGSIVIISFVMETYTFHRSKQFFARCRFRLNFKLAVAIAMHLLGKYTKMLAAALSIKPIFRRLPNHTKNYYGY